MIADRPTSLIDPVCQMTVDVARAEAAGLLVENEGRTYAFCRSGCRRAFLDGPEEDAQLARLAQLGELKAAGVLTEAEFETQKARILGS